MSVKQVGYTAIQAIPVDLLGNEISAVAIGNAVAAAIGGGGMGGTPQTPISGTATGTAADALPANAARMAYKIVNNGSNEIRISEGFDATTTSLIPLVAGAYYESTAAFATARISVIAVSGTSAYVIQESV